MGQSNQYNLSMFTIIAYKENNSDYCRGCLMDSWGSGFIIENWSEAIEKAVEIKNIKRDEYENEYELTVISNDGRLIIENDQPSEFDEYNNGRDFLNQVREASKQLRLSELERKQNLELEKVRAVELERIRKEVIERDRLLALHPLS